MARTIGALNKMGTFLGILGKTPLPSEVAARPMSFLTVFICEAPAAPRAIGMLWDAMIARKTTATPAFETKSGTVPYRANAIGS
jgi:hypothetical protein